MLQIREAKANFSALAAAAEKGRPTLVSRHGKPCAMVVPVADGARFYPLEMPTLANHLLCLPEPLATDRDTTPLGVACADPLIALPVVAKGPGSH